MEEEEDGEVPEGFSRSSTSVSQSGISLEPGLNALKTLSPGLAEIGYWTESLVLRVDRDSWKEM